jgi:hypothetical protein
LNSLIAHQRMAYGMTPNARTLPDCLCSLVVIVAHQWTMRRCLRLLLPLAVVTALGTKASFNILHIENYRTSFSHCVVGNSVLFASLWMNCRKVAKGWIPSAVIARFCSSFQCFSQEDNQLNLLFYWWIPLFRTSWSEFWDSSGKAERWSSSFLLISRLYAKHWPLCFAVTSKNSNK